jgi:Fe-S cluster assembly protein SufD
LGHDGDAVLLLHVLVPTIAEAHALSITLDDVTALPGPVWLEASRRTAWERFEGRTLPSSALEEWRYSRIDSLDLDRYRPWTSDGASVRVPDGLTALVDALGAAAVVVVRNGADVSMTTPVEGVTVEEPGTEPVEVGAVSGEPDALTTLNAALSRPITVTVAAGVRLPGPVVVVHAVDADGIAVFPRTVIRVGRAAEAGVVEISWSSADVDALTVPVTEIDVADGAHARYLHLQRLGPRVWQTGLQASRVGRDAALTSVAVALGGDYARLRTDSALVGAGGSTDLLAVYFGTGTRMVDFRTKQDHRAPKTTSRLLYKGAVANRSRAVYTGLIRVEKGARGTNAFQTNRNLVLHEGASAESVPNLEIEDNDVRCSHASAVGPISEDQRFYLESRGVPTDAADRLITLGFLEEVLDQLGLAPVAAWVRAEIAARLDEAQEVEADSTKGGIPR